MSKGRVQDKVTIVTGGSRGIGGATVRRFVEEGAKVVIFDMLDEEGTALATSLGAKVTYQNVDITKEASVSAAVRKVADAHGRIDILVNNAGIPGVNKFAHEVEVAEWDRVFDVNVKGMFLCTKHVLPHMMKQKAGSIVNFSSIYGLIGNIDLPPYHATKGAVLMMTKTDAICYAPHGIRVNAVRPGLIDTEIHAPRGGLDKIREMAMFPEYEHWLGGVYVVEQARGQGVASLLVTEILSRARRAGISKLYLQTENLTGGVYCRHGFKAVEEVNDKGVHVLVMVADTGI